MVENYYRIGFDAFLYCFDDSKCLGCSADIRVFGGLREKISISSAIDGTGNTAPGVQGLVGLVAFLQRGESKLNCSMEVHRFRIRIG